MPQIKRLVYDPLIYRTPKNNLHIRMRKHEYCFLALGACRVGTHDLDETESAQWQQIPLKEVRAMIAAGVITSASTVAAFCKALVALDESRPM
jgi:hypothetical protein